MYCCVVFNFESTNVFVAAGLKILLFNAKFNAFVIPAGLLVNKLSLVFINISKYGWTLPVESKYYGFPAFPTIGWGGYHLVSNLIWKDVILHDKA